MAQSYAQLLLAVDDIEIEEQLRIVTSYNKFHFDRLLLSHIEFEKNEEAILMLNDNLLKASDDFGTLLHYSAVFGNQTLARHLIEMGCDVDHSGQDDKTPLMVAVQYCENKCVKVFLEANANIELVNAEGNTAFQMIFDHISVSKNILDIFIKKIEDTAVTSENIVAKFSSAGGNMFHAACMRNIKLMKRLLEYGVNINSSGPKNRTALMNAAYYLDFPMIDWLLQNGAYVNAQDEDGRSVLSFAAENMNKTLLQLLLEHGANPNMNGDDINSPLLFDFLSRESHDENMIEYIELLFQYGTIPSTPRDSDFTIFDVAVVSENPMIPDYLIAQLAFLKKSGNKIDQSVIHCNLSEMEKHLDRLKEYYKLCEQILDIKMFQNLTLFALLTHGESKLKIYVRNKKFMSKVKAVCCNQVMSELYPYYHKMLMKRVNKAADLVKLEDVGIPIISRLFKCNNEQLSIAARNIVSYLDEADLERLAEVCSDKKQDHEYIITTNEIKLIMKL